MDRLVFSPLIGSPFLEVALALMIALAAFTLYRLRRAGLLRVAMTGLLILVFLNPTLALRETAPLKSIVALVVDRSGSQTLSTRMTQTDAVVEDIEKKVKALPSLELRKIEVRDRDDEGTRLFAPLRDALADVPTERIGGALLVTDGLVEDAPFPSLSSAFKHPFML